MGGSLTPVPRLIQKIWAESGDQPLAQKLRNVKQSLKIWNVTEYGCIDSKISELENKIHDFDMKANECMLEDHEIAERNSAQADLWKWMKRKESYWAQASRAKWIKEGDKNTKYFHIMASIRQRKNLIEHLKMGDNIIDDPDQLKCEATAFFSKIFKEENHLRPTLENLDFRQLDPQQSLSLTAPFSRDEIDAAVNSCDSNKSPGPDGFNFKFIKSSWETIKEDIYSMVEEFYSSSSLPRGSNNTFITLIPKSENPSDFKDYRPISMVGCLYKIVAKLLARRLQTVMHHLIGPHQSSFIKGRQILDGALIASELIDSCKKNKTEAMILKLDFHKAFDCVSWSYLDWTLEKMNFPVQWRKWI